MISVRTNTSNISYPPISKLGLFCCGIFRVPLLKRSLYVGADRQVVRDELGDPDSYYDSKKVPLRTNQPY